MTHAQGPALFFTPKSIFSESKKPAYLISKNESVNLTYLFAVLGDPEFLRMVKLPEKLSYVEQLEYVNDLVSLDENNTLTECKVEIIKR